MLLRLLGKPRAAKRDCAVLIGVRNRLDYRLENSIRSLAQQDYPAPLIVPTVIDYGSDPDVAWGLHQLCAEYRCRLVRVNGPNVWNRAHCLNIGIRATTARFTLLSDVDILYSASFIQSMVTPLSARDDSVAYGYVYDLPESTSPQLAATARDKKNPNFACMRPYRKRRYKRSRPARGICGTSTRVLRILRGLDEYFTGWGKEDDDLYKRLQLFRAKEILLPKSSNFLHQWHPRFEGIDSSEIEEVITRNAAYLASRHSAVRNDDGWGTADVEISDFALQGK